MYFIGKAMNTAMTFEVDEVIDPAMTRHWIAQASSRAGQGLEVAREGEAALRRHLVNDSPPGWAFGVGTGNITARRATVPGSKPSP